MSTDATNLLEEDHRAGQRPGFDFISGKPKRAGNEDPEPIPDNHHKRDA